METYKVTDAHLKKYEKYAESYIAKLGLFDWERYYRKETHNGAMASCGADLEGRLAILMVADQWDGIPVTDKELKNAAKHEVFELLLWELCNVLRKPGVTDEEVHSVRHAVIRRLEQVIA